MRGQILEPRNKDGELIGTGIDERECQNFFTVDTAGTSAEKAKEKKGANPSWSVMAAWSYASNHGNALFLRHIWRARVDYPGLKAGVRNMAQRYPGKVYIENAHFGPALFDELKTEMQIEMMPTNNMSDKRQTGTPGKVERASKFITKLERGEVFYPKYNNDWLPDYVSELISWTGLPEDTDDQVDVSSHAANIVSEAKPIVIQAGRGFMDPVQGFDW